MSVTPTRDLRSVFGTARDQGDRPTCCAFACSDLHAASRLPWTTLSNEYAFFHAVRRQGTGPTHGVHLDHVLDAIELDGQPVEEAWPYLSFVPVDASLWVPPTSIDKVFRAKGVRSFGDVIAIRAAITQDHPTLIVLTLSDAFFRGPDDEGVIDSAEPVDPTRVHAVIAVGYGTRSSHAFTLVRNSWGDRWGVSGHAWLSDRYLEPRIVELASMKVL